MVFSQIYGIVILELYRGKSPHHASMPTSYCDFLKSLNLNIAWTHHYLQCQFYMFICLFPHHCSNGTLHSSVSVVIFALPREARKIYYPFFNIIVVEATMDKIAVSFQQSRGQGFAIRWSVTVRCSNPWAILPFQRAWE